MGIIREFFRDGDEVPQGFVSVFLIMVLSWLAAFGIGFGIAYVIYA